MSSDLYSSKVLELSTNIKNVAEFIAPNIDGFSTSTKISKICGSKVSVAIKLDPQNAISDFLINPKACALGQASASILSQSIIGARAKEVIAARDALFNMLKNKEKYQLNYFSDLSYLEAVQDYPMRHSSVMLAWNAAVEAIENAQSKN